MSFNALEDLFVQELHELYDVEQQIENALPAMAKAASRSELRAAFETHLKQTKNHVTRLEKIFKAFGREPERKSCDPVAGIIAQGQRLVSDKQSDEAVLDAGLISVAQKIEHFEISSYGSARAHAKLLGYSKIADLLGDTLEEEEQTDRLLTKLALNRVNVEAAKAPYGRARTEARGGEPESSGLGFGSLLAGLSIGAAIALLWAPRSGEELRSEIRQRANEGMDYLQDRSDEVRDTASDLLERGKQVVTDQKDRISSTIDASKQAFRG